MYQPGFPALDIDHPAIGAVAPKCSMNGKQMERLVRGRVAELWFGARVHHRPCPSCVWRQVTEGREQKGGGESQGPA